MKRRCFVIMPFSKTESCTDAEWTEVFDQIIKPAVKGSRLGFECVRSQIRTGAFIKDILDELNSAEVVIADLTDRNANVFYELGVRHALQNRSVLISQDMKHVPSDLQPYGVIVYSRTLGGRAQFKKDLSRVLHDILNDPERNDNPVSDFLTTRDHVLFQYERVQAARKLAALISELSRNLSNRRKVVDRLTQALEADKTKPATLSFHTTALDLLVGTNYVVLPDHELANAHTVLHFISTINNQLDMWRQESSSCQILKVLKSNLEKLEGPMVRLLKATKVTMDKIATSQAPDDEIPHYFLADKSHSELLEPKGDSEA